MPFIAVLLALRAEIAAAVEGRTIGAKPIGVRHARHRETKEAERPCVGLRFISNDASELGEQTTSMGLPEQVMELVVNLVIDLDLKEEADAYDDLTGDPTGYGDQAQIIAWILDRLLPDLEAGAEVNSLGGLAWRIRYDGTAPDEGDASPDMARMEERLTIFYRVRADHPTELLPESV